MAGPRWFAMKSMCRSCPRHRSPRRTEMPCTDPVQTAPDCRPKPARQDPECVGGSSRARLDSADRGAKYQTRDRRALGCSTGCAGAAPPSLSRSLDWPAAPTPSNGSIGVQAGSIGFRLAPIECPPDWASGVATPQRLALAHAPAWCRRLRRGGRLAVLRETC